MKIQAEILELRLKHTFRIASGATDLKRNVIVHIGEGIGEAAPALYLGEWYKSVLACLEFLEPELGDDPALIEEIEDRISQKIGFNFAAKAAIDLALHDHLSKKAGVPLFQFLGLTKSEEKKTSVTIAIAEPKEMAQRAVEAKTFPILKVKVGVPGDMEKVTAVRRARPDAAIRVDANCGWTLVEALEKMPLLEQLSVELVEAPLDSVDIEGLRLLRTKSPLPIFLDEGVMTAKDIPGYAPVADGINVKLMKCGGLREALRMIREARRLNLKVMLGCMLESAIGVTAAAHLAGLADYLDLDSILLTDNDPYQGAAIENGVLRLPQRPGIGVVKVG